MEQRRRIVWSAGEASGDLIAAPVIAHLAASQVAPEQAGVGGPAMKAAGLSTWVGIEQLSVRGYVEVLRELPRLLRLRRDLARRAAAWPADLFVGVDAPDFNLGLARRLRRSGVRTMHFVGPSVWAWRAERLKKIRGAVDHMLLIFPFEAPLYEAAGVPATYVGHPLADVLDPAHFPKAEMRARLDLPADARIVCLMPGSRPSEVGYMGELFVRTARWLLARDPGMRFVLPAATPALAERLRALLGPLESGRGGAVRLLDGDAHRAIGASDAVLVASGTATLEVALLRRPMVITYRMSPISYRIMKRMALQPWVGLPNILCRDSVVPELLQDEATPERLGAGVVEMLDPRAAARVEARLSALRETMAIGCAARAAGVIEAHLR